MEKYYRTSILEAWVARWHIFKPKIKIWVIFAGSYNGRGWLICMDIWSILQPFVIIHGHWYILWKFGYIFPVLVGCTKKNLAALFRSTRRY
jgi:hypothetical protein